MVFCISSVVRTGKFFGFEQWQLPSKGNSFSWALGPGGDQTFVTKCDKREGWRSILHQNRALLPVVLGIAWRFSWEAIVPQQPKKPKDSLPRSQQFASGSHPETDETRPHSPTLSTWHAVECYSATYAYVYCDDRRANGEYFDSKMSYRNM